MECTICLTLLTDDPAAGEDAPKMRKQGEEGKGQLCSLPCGHIFHKYCVLKWLETKPMGQCSCPICRKQFKEARQLKNVFLPTSVDKTGELMKKNERLERELEQLKKKNEELAKKVGEEDDKDDEVDEENDEEDQEDDEEDQEDDEEDQEDDEEDQEDDEVDEENDEEDQEDDEEDQEEEDQEDDEEDDESPYDNMFGPDQGYRKIPLTAYPTTKIVSKRKSGIVAVGVNKRKRNSSSTSSSSSSSSKSSATANGKKASTAFSRFKAAAKKANKQGNGSATPKHSTKKGAVAVPVGRKRKADSVSSAPAKKQKVVPDAKAFFKTTGKKTATATGPGIRPSPALKRDGKPAPDLRRLKTQLVSKVKPKKK